MKVTFTALAISLLLAGRADAIKIGGIASPATAPPTGSSLLVTTGSAILVAAGNRLLVSP